MLADEGGRVHAVRYDLGHTQELAGRSRGNHCRDQAGKGEDGQTGYGLCLRVPHTEPAYSRGRRCRLSPGSSRARSTGLDGESQQCAAVRIA